MTSDFMAHIHLLVDAESAREFAEAGGINLGQMIDLLTSAEKLGADRDAPVAGLVEPHSYRGYYERLSFEEGPTTLRAMLETAQKCIGATFQGYKGGDFTMGRNSLVHVAPYGTAPDDDELTIARLLAIIAQAHP
jgi:hypothetical protein